MSSLSPIVHKYLQKNYVKNPKKEATSGEKLLGNVIFSAISGDTFSHVFDLVSSEDFFLDHEKRLFDTLRDMNESDGFESIGIITLCHKMQEKKDQYWNLDSISRIALPEHNLVPIAQQLSPFARDLKNKAASVRIIQSAEILLQTIGSRASEDPTIALEQHLSTMNDMILKSPSGKNDILMAEDVWPEWIEKIENRIKNEQDDSRRIKLGLASFDEILPMSKTNFVILAGRPGVGKTSSLLFLVNQIIIANPEKIGLVLSLEQPIEEILEKRVASEAHLEVMKFKTPKEFKEDELDRLMAAVKLMADREQHKLGYVDKAVLKMGDIRQQVKRMKKARGGLDWVAIDYLGLIKADSSAKDNYHKITAISNDLKRLAREENILVISLCQLNRDSAKDQKKPEMKDLRDSGAIEQDADAIIFVHRQNYYKGEEVLREKGSSKFQAVKDQGVQEPLDDHTYLLIRKNRHGAKQRVDIPFTFFPETGKMVPVRLEQECEE